MSAATDRAGPDRSPDRYLAVYLRNHRAAAGGGVRLAQRVAREYAHTTAGPRLRDIADQIREDCTELDAVMRTLHVSPSTVGSVLAAAGERVGRLKPNGSPVRRSPLTPVVELEMLIAGVHAKAQGWCALRLRVPTLDTTLLDRLLDRAADQAATLDDLWSAALTGAFGPGSRS